MYLFFFYSDKKDQNEGYFYQHSASYLETFTSVYSKSVYLHYLQ